MIEFGDLQYHALARLASACMIAAVEDREDEMTECLRTIDARYGAEGVGIALLMWCDSWLEYAGLTSPGHYGPVFGHLRAQARAKHLHPQVQWVIDCLQARTTRDVSAWKRCLDTLAHVGPDGTRLRVYTMVLIFADTFNAMEPGFGRQICEESERGR